MNDKLDFSIYGSDPNEQYMSVLITTDECKYILTLMTKFLAEEGGVLNNAYIVEADRIDTAFVTNLLNSVSLSDILRYLIPQIEEE